MITITPKLAGIVAASAVALMAPAAFAAGPHKSVKAAPKTQKAAKKSVKTAWSFPPCTNTQADYEYIYSGDPCTSTSPAPSVWKMEPASANESGVLSLAPAARENGASCNGNAEYEYIYSGCQS